LEKYHHSLVIGIWTMRMRCRYLRRPWSTVSNPRGLIPLRWSADAHNQVRLTTSKVLGNCQTQSTIRSTKTKSIISLGASFAEFEAIYVWYRSVPYLNQPELEKNINTHHQSRSPRILVFLYQTLVAAKHVCIRTWTVADTVLQLVIGKTLHMDYIQHNRVLTV
jgi:hypothetical protein